MITILPIAFVLIAMSFWLDAKIARERANTEAFKRRLAALMDKQP